MARRFRLLINVKFTYEMLQGRAGIERIILRLKYLPVNLE